MSRIEQPAARGSTRPLPKFTPFDGERITLETASDAGFNTLSPGLTPLGDKRMNVEQLVTWKLSLLLGIYVFRQ